MDLTEDTAKDVGALLEKKALVRRNGKGTHSFFVPMAPYRFIEEGGRFWATT